MGGFSSSECACQEGFLGYCAPQDPKDEQANTVVAQPPPVYPGAVSTPAAVPPTYQQETRYDETGFGAADDASLSYGNEGVFAPPPTRPPDSYETPVSSQQGRRQDGGSGVTLDDVLSNLESSEEFVYGQVFSTFPSAGGVVALDCPAMRDFVCTTVQFQWMTSILNC